jgi:hypothetical protein
VLDFSVLDGDLAVVQIDFLDLAVGQDADCWASVLPGSMLAWAKLLMGSAIPMATAEMARICLMVFMMTLRNTC